MAFMGGMKDKFSQASRSTVQKAKNLSELARLNSVISDTETQINELYGKIGYEVYCAYKEAPLPEIEELIVRISELNKTIDICKLQIQVINAVNTCPQCGAKTKKEMIFCSACGFKLEEILKSEENERTLFCRNCGAPVMEGFLFCTSCGKKIE